MQASDLQELQDFKWEPVEKKSRASKKETRRMIFEKEETCCEETKRVEGEMSEQWGHCYCCSH